MKIVPFGATGNIGRHVGEALRRGHEVVGVVRDPATVQSPDPRVTLVRGDATDAESVAEVVKGADAVVSAISPRPNPRGLPAPRLADNARALIAGLRTGVWRSEAEGLDWAYLQPRYRDRPGRVDRDLPHHGRAAPVRYAIRQSEA